MKRPDYFGKFKYQIYVDGAWHDVPDEAYIQTEIIEKVEGASVLDFVDSQWRKKARKCKVRPR